MKHIARKNLNKFGKESEGEIFKCSICGKSFNDTKTDRAMYWIPANIFTGWTHEILNPKRLSVEPMKTKIIFKNTFWKIIAYTKVQRDIIYFCWEKTKGKKKVAYYECERCM